MHDGAGGGVLKKLPRVGVEMFLDRERDERRLVKAAQDELLLAGVDVDVADREDPRDAGLELLGVHRDLALLHPEAPLGDRAQVRREAVEDEHLFGVHRVLRGVLLERIDLDPLQRVAFLDEAADPPDEDTDAIRLRLGHRPQPLDRDGLRPEALAPVHQGEALRRRSQLQRPVEGRVASAQNRYRLVTIPGLVEHLVVDVDAFVPLHAGNAQRPWLKGAETSRDHHGTGEEPGPGGRLQRERAVGLARELHYHLVQMEIGLERTELLREALDELVRSHHRKRGDVVDRLLRVERGALPANLRQRVHHVRVDPEQPQLEDLEQAARAGADDDHVGLDAHADAVLPVLWQIEIRHAGLRYPAARFVSSSMESSACRAPISAGDGVRSVREPILHRPVPSALFAPHKRHGAGGHVFAIAAAINGAFFSRPSRDNSPPRYMRYHSLR